MARVLLFGTGSVGTVHAMILQMAGADVICVCRSNFEAVKTRGFTVHSTIFGRHTFFPTVVESIQDAVTFSQGIPFDFVVVCTKAFPSSSPSPALLISPAVHTGHTSIVVIQNGVGVEKPYHEAFATAGNTVISGVTYLPTSQISSGVYSHTETQKLHLGSYPAEKATPSDDTHTEAFAALIRAGGADVTVHADVQIERWRKLIGNTTWNPICALSRCRDLEFLRASDMAMAFVKKAMHEVVLVANALGYGQYIQADAVEMQVQRSAIRIWPGVEPSMLHDIAQDRPLEVEAIIGQVIQVAQDHDVDVPRLESLYVLLMGLNWSAQNRN